MQSDRAYAISVSLAELGTDALAWEAAQFSLEDEAVERGAQALFEFVFSSTERLDGNHLWANCDDKIKAGFRAEARAVLKAVTGRYPVPALL